MMQLDPFEKLFIDTLEELLCNTNKKVMEEQGMETSGRFEWKEKRPEDYYAEVWQFMKDTDVMSAKEYCECFGSGREVFDIFTNFKDAKKAYSEYKKKKEEIKPGDYVKVKISDSTAYKRYRKYDILVVNKTKDSDPKPCLPTSQPAYRCIARKKDGNNCEYVTVTLFADDIQKTGKRCLFFDERINSLFAYY